MTTSELILLFSNFAGTFAAWALGRRGGIAWERKRRAETDALARTTINSAFRNARPISAAEMGSIERSRNYVANPMNERTTRHHVEDGTVQGMALGLMAGQAMNGGAQRPEQCDVSLPASSTSCDTSSSSNSDSGGGAGSGE